MEHTHPDMAQTIMHVLSSVLWFVLVVNGVMKIIGIERLIPFRFVKPTSQIQSEERVRAAAIVLKNYGTNDTSTVTVREIQGNATIL